MRQPKMKNRKKRRGRKAKGRKALKPVSDNSKHITNNRKKRKRKNASKRKALLGIAELKEDDRRKPVSDTSIHIVNNQNKRKRKKARQRKIASNVSCNVSSKSLDEKPITKRRKIEKENSCHSSGLQASATCCHTNGLSTNAGKAVENEKVKPGRVERKSVATKKVKRRNSVATKKGKEKNSVATKKAKRNSVATKEAKRNSVATKEAKRNSVATKEAKRNSVATKEGRHLKAGSNNVRKQSPLLSLIWSGEKAKFNIGAKEADTPLVVADLQPLLLYVLNKIAPHACKWYYHEKPLIVRHTVLVIVDGVTCDDFRQHAELAKPLQEMFELLFEVLAPEIYGSCLLKDLLWVQLNTMHKDMVLQYDEDVRKLINEGEIVLRDKLEMWKRELGNCINNGQTVPLDGKKETKTEKREFSRISLMLNPFEMREANYPLNNSIKSLRNYVYTKDIYLPVTPTSPLFAIDCEMCITTESPSELTRVSVVNENLECVYDTFVKPRNTITDYLTRYSGVTPEILNDVTTRLEDVQKRIRDILPADAIVCGQSLENDFHALKMIHPYVIDSSVIYNMSGNRNRPTSLRRLAIEFLGESIQTESSGHDSVEDARTALKLVLLKLSRNVCFGDAVLTKIALAKCRSIDDILPIYDNGLCRSLFKYTIEGKKKVAIVSHGATYRSEYLEAKEKLPTKEFIYEHDATGTKDVVNKTVEVLNSHDLTISHMSVSLKSGNEQPEFMRLTADLQRIYKALVPNSLLVVIFNNGTCKSPKRISSNSLCMMTLKTVC